MSDDRVVYLTTAPNEPIALMWADMLREAEIPVIVQPGGPGAGAWGSVAVFEHVLSVRQRDLVRAQELLEAETDGAWDEE